MASDPPDGSSTVVLAWRVLSAGMLMPDKTTAPSVVSSLTSLSIFRLMRPSDSTTGVKARPTPNFLNCTVSLPSLSTTGTGNSPPARKLAVSPDTAVRLGSARVRIRPSRSSARSALAARVSPPWKPLVTPELPNVLPAGPLFQLQSEPWSRTSTLRSDQCGRADARDRQRAEAGGGRQRQRVLGQQRAS